MEEEEAFQDKDGDENADARWRGRGKKEKNENEDEEVWVMEEEEGLRSLIWMERKLFVPWQPDASKPTTQSHTSNDVERQVINIVGFY